MSLQTALLALLIQPGAWTADGAWSFDPAPDRFGPEAAVDLRPMNEPQAGQNGFIKATAEGGFALGSGEPVRFWAVNSGVGREAKWTARPLWPHQKEEPSLARHARFLAKHGVNLVRLHAQVAPRADAPGAKLSDINQAERDWIWRAVAAFRKEGIYTVISPYWAVPMKLKAEWGVTGGAADNALGLLFFEPKMQEAYRAWMRQLLGEKNPHTGLTLAQDPAVAIFQLQNEDSLLFWTFNAITGEPRRMLEAQWSAWLRQKHGSLSAARTAWSGFEQPGDDMSAGRLVLMNIWEMTQPRQGGAAARLKDQTEFLSRTMHKWNQETIAWMRSELKAGWLVNCGNWKTADTIRLGDAERWSYTAGEVDAVNTYFAPVHQGQHNGWAIVNGDRYAAASALANPAQLPTLTRQTAGRPMMVTESTWVPPTPYGAEGPLLTAATSGLTGLDAYFWFATGEEQWMPPISANGYMASGSKWTFATPEVLGSFASAALIHRKGMVRQAAPVLTEARSLEDIWSRRTPLLAESPSFDPNRDAGDIAPASSVKTALEPRAFLQGPVQAKFGLSAAGTVVRELAPGYGSGPLRFDPAAKTFLLDTPQAQAASGFWRGATARLSTVDFTPGAEFGSYIAVSLDGRPLTESEKVLVQCITQARPQGWREQAVELSLEGGAKRSGFEIESFGQAPWQVKNSVLMVKISNPKLRRAVFLDPNYYPQESAPISADGLKFLPNRMSALLTP